jgi:hypothetical protein
LNQFDITTCVSGLTIQTVRNSFKILKETLSNEEIKQFESQKVELESKLNAAVSKILGTNTTYNEFKGEYFAAHETIIGKDNTMHKFERV